MPGEGEQLTGVSDNAYNLSSVLYHAAQGGTQYAKYIEDAEREGDQELADFFRRVRDEDSMRADEAQMLIAARTLATTVSISDEPGAGATAAPSEGLAAGAPRREETTGRVEGRPDMDAAATDPAMGAGRGGEPDIPPRTAGIEEGVTPRTEEASPREGVTGDAPLRTEEESAPPDREDRLSGR